MKQNASAAATSRRNANGSDPLGNNSEIGRKLKQYYDELITEDVPDRFSDLLKQLEEKEEPTPAPEGE